MGTENFDLQSNIWLLKKYSDQLLEFNKIFWYIKCFVSGRVKWLHYVGHTNVGCENIHFSICIWNTSIRSTLRRNPPRNL